MTKSERVIRLFLVAVLVLTIGSFSLLLLIGIPALAAVRAGAPTAGGARAWTPQPYTVERNDTLGLLTLSTPYYTIQHDLRRGGAVSSIRLTHGQAKNLLVRPIETSVHVAPPRITSPGGQRGGQPLIYSDIHDSSPRVSQEKSEDRQVVVIEASLLNAKKEDSGVKSKTTYTYRWGYIKIHKEVVFPERSVVTKELSVLSTTLDPSLSYYGYRPGVRELMERDPFTYQTEQIRQWGRIRPGTHFDLTLATRQLPRYLVFANQGVEGIEWFMSDNLEQWDYQMTGEPGTSYCSAQASTDPLGIALSISPVALSSAYDLPKGGDIALRGTYSFDYYLAVPILEGHAWNPWFNKSYRANGGRWVSEEQIRQNAADGVLTMHLHNDGDARRDGLFWRDGSYPPYPPAEMAKMDQTIAAIHKHGMKTAVYFSNLELNQSTEEFKTHGREWGRIVDDQSNLRPDYTFGALMCLKSGWLDFLKFGVDRVLKNHAFDGVYFDWNIAMFCTNPLHVGKKTSGVSGEKGLGALAISRATHWDIDELIDLAEWARKRVGPDGIIILHNTLVPMFATENFANYVVGMEAGYGRLSLSVPPPDELPLEWNFAGARPRAVIGYGTIAPGAPKRLFQAHAVATLMTSVAPWPVTAEAIELYKILKPLGDLEQYQFEDYRNQAITIDARNTTSAIYSKPGEAYVLLANLGDQSKTIRCTLAPAKLRHPLSRVTTAELVGAANRVPLDAKRLTSVGEEIRLPADGVVLVRVQ